MYAIAALAGALGTFDAEHVELALDVTENKVGAGHCEEKAPLDGGAEWRKSKEILVSL
jgi:hypothetical protein